MMKKTKHTILTALSLMLVVFLAACGGSDENTSDKKEEKEAETRIYKSETGDVKVPANPKRIISVPSTYTGNLLALGITPVGVTADVKDNKFYEGKLDDVEEITADSVEKIFELEPDLIISTPDNKNNKKYAEIAPTVVFSYEKYQYLDQHIEIGKLVNKEKEAKAWVEEWNKKTEEAGKEIRAKIGEDATVMVMELFNKDLYVFGDNWGRGTEVLYQALKLKAPEKVIQDAMGPGYHAISAEVIPEYAGDYIILSESGSENPDTTFKETNVWKNIPAVKNNKVISIDSKSFWFNDPITVEKELEFFKEQLLK